MSREVFGRVNNNRTTSQSLLVEVKIKNKASKNILIEDWSDWSVIDQQIKWFLSTSNLKEEAFSYIKGIIANKIKTSSIHSNSTHNIEPVSPENKENFPKMKVQTSLKIEKHSSTRTLEPCCISININNKTSCLEDYQESYREETDINEKSNHNRQSFVFSSSFTLPSSVGGKERTLLTDMKFEDAFDTVGKHSQDFSSINEITKDRPLLSARPLFLSPSLPNPPSVSKKPVKITLFKKSRNKEELIECGVPKVIKKEEKSLRDSNEFCIYEKEEESKMQKEFEKKSEFDEKLRMLFKKLTQHNPGCLKEVHSQYVSYEELNRAELRVMGTLFERIDHRELPHLNFSRFRRNVLELCQEELPSLMSQICVLPFRI